MPTNSNSSLRSAILADALDAIPIQDEDEEEMGAVAPLQEGMEGRRQ